MNMFEITQDVFQSSASRLFPMNPTGEMYYNVCCYCLYERETAAPIEAFLHTQIPRKFFLYLAHNDDHFIQSIGYFEVVSIKLQYQFFELLVS